MKSEKPNVDALPLVWGAKNIAAALKLPAGEKSERKVFYMAEAGRLAGLRSVGRQLVLNTQIFSQTFKDAAGE